MADWPTIAVRLGLYASLTVAFGLAAFALYALRADERRDALALRPWLVVGVAAATSLSALALLLTASSMAGVGLTDLDRETVGLLVTAPGMGTAWQARGLALLVAIGTIPFLGRGTAPLAVAAAALGVASATLAWTGHGAASEGAAGWAHLAADVAHLIASGAWLGALAGLALLLFPADAGRAHLILTHRALHGFGVVGTVVVAVLVLSGLVNAWMLIGPDNVWAAVGTLYGRLLLAKLVLFGVMLALAAANRWRLTPTFGRAIDTGHHDAALALLRRSLALEVTAAAVILALVAWLGTLAPPTAGG